MNIARKRRRKMVKIGISVNLERALNRLWRKARPSNLVMEILKSLKKRRRRRILDRTMAEYSFRRLFPQDCHGAPLAGIMYN